MDRVFSALAHPARRRMLDLVQANPGMNIAAVAERFRMSGVGVLKHVHVLEEAGLIHAERSGRERRLYFNAVPIQMIYDRWTDRYGAFWAGRMADIKERVESRVQRKAVRNVG